MRTLATASLIARGVLLAACLATLLPSSAAAHGRIPNVYDVVPGPDGELTLVTTFGLVAEGADGWYWACRSALGLSASEDPRFLRLPSGEFVGGTFDGLLRVDERLCDQSLPVSALREVVVIDVEPHPTDPAVFFALTSSSGIDNLLYRSEDGGASWSPTGDPIEPILFERVRVAPSQPERIYLSGAYPRTAVDTERRLYVHRSNDGGATWERIAFEFRPGERNIYVLAVDPTDPEIVFARVIRERDMLADLPERLIRSTDGGETWETVLEVRGEISAMTFHRGDAFVGVPNTPDADLHGLWRSADGVLFEQLRADLSVGCLRSEGDTLYACASDFADGFAVGRSVDRGLSFEPVFRLSELRGPVVCDAARAETCATDDEDLFRDLMIPAQCDAGCDSGADGGTSDAGVDGGGSGCGCTAAGASAPSPAWVLIAAFAWTRRLRRR